MGNDGEAAIRAVQGNRSEARRGSKVAESFERAIYENRATEVPKKPNVQLAYCPPSWVTEAAYAAIGITNAAFQSTYPIGSSWSRLRCLAWEGLGSCPGCARPPASVGIHRILECRAAAEHLSASRPSIAASNR